MVKSSRFGIYIDVEACRFMCSTHVVTECSPCADKHFHVMHNLMLVLCRARLSEQIKFAGVFHVTHAHLTSNHVPSVASALGSDTV